MILITERRAESEEHGGYCYTVHDRRMHNRTCASGGEEVKLAMDVADLISRRAGGAEEGDDVTVGVLQENVARVPTGGPTIEQAVGGTEHSSTVDAGILLDEV